MELVNGDTDYLTAYYQDYIDAVNDLNEFKELENYRERILGRLINYANTLIVMERAELRHTKITQQMKELRKKKQRAASMTAASSSELPGNDPALGGKIQNSSYLQKKCSQLTMLLSVAQNEKKNSDKLANEYKALYQRLLSSNQANKTNNDNPAEDKTKQITSLSISLDPITTVRKNKTLETFKSNGKFMSPMDSKNLMGAMNGMETSTPVEAIPKKSGEKRNFAEFDFEEEDDDLEVSLIDTPSKVSQASKLDQGLNLVSSLPPLQERESSTTTTDNSKPKKITKRKFRKVVPNESPKKNLNDIYEDSFNHSIEQENIEKAMGAIPEITSPSKANSVLPATIKLKRPAKRQKNSDVKESSSGEVFISPLKNRNESLKKNIFK